MTPYTTLHLISDGRGGQNKNTILITMVGKWFEDAPNHIKEIQLVFPISGHRFLPPDRIFGNIEKETRKHEVIISPDEYNYIIGRYGTVKRLGDEAVVQNWKGAAEAITKRPASYHFRIQPSRRLYFTRTFTKMNNETVTNVLVQG